MAEIQALKTVPCELDPDKFPGLDGITFETTQFSAFRAMELLHELGKEGGSTADLTGISPGMILKMLAGTTAHVPSGATSLTMEFSGAKARSNFDLVFSNRLGIMMKVLEHALHVNFDSFNVGGPETPAAPPVADPAPSS